ncbi:hypothetical protein M436DRAFT_81485 [Aureobasidium namibiae CBS 147.97]|uniref:Uncharacterized protein n=1 Tax=Aureobasidium namibiae CBS 147.97 TaxID=1043004 RepID=A0A074WWG5_9PEZI
MGNSVPDLFFLDNPNLRHRASELRDNISALQVEEETLNRIRDKLDKLMEERGFNNPDELEKKVLEIVNSEELKKYQALKERLDTRDKAEGIVWDVIGLVGASTGIIAGAWFAAGIVTGGAALAATAVVGEALAVIGAVLVLSAIIAGAEERDNLRKAIDELWPKRAQMKQCVEQMRAVANWAEAIGIWLNSPSTSDPSTMNTLLAATLDRDYGLWTMQHVDEVLLDQDRRNDSWTDEDPTHQADAVAFVVRPMLARELADPKPATVTLDILPSGGTSYVSGADLGERKMNFSYSEFLAPDTVLATSGGQTWKITAKPQDKDNPTLETVLFDFETIPSGVSIGGGAFKGGFEPLITADLPVGAAFTGCQVHTLATTTA